MERGGAQGFAGRNTLCEARAACGWPSLSAWQNLRNDMHHVTVTRPPPRCHLTKSSHLLFHMGLDLIKARVSFSASDAAMKGDTGSSLKSALT